MSYLTLLLVGLVGMVSADLDQVNNFCRRFGHQTAVIDNRLYIDGGFINYNPISQYPTNYTNTALLYEDLDVIASSKMPQLFSNVTKNQSVPDVHGGFLWADDVNKKFFLFGGEYYQTPPPTSFNLWSYDHIYGYWTSQSTRDQITINPVSYGAGVSVNSRGEGYYYGGWLSNNSVSGWQGAPVATTGLIKYDMVTGTLSNITGPDNTRRAEGVMVFIPASDAGMLVYFGGGRDMGNGTFAGEPMNNIYLYDVLSSKWYVQNATGNVPGMRGRFCAGVSYPDDQSSYNIYLYGGASYGANTYGYDDVYVLSIPSFQWIKLYPSDGTTQGYPHHSLTCNIINGGQMIVMGGTFPLSDDCDAQTQWGTHNLDLGATQGPSFWQLFAPNITKYTVPSAIYGAIGGSASGGATATAAADNFASNSDLKTLMTRKAQISARTATRATTTATSNSNSSTSISTGAIAGIAVGGAVVVLGALIGCCWFVRKHRARILLAKGFQPSQFPPKTGEIGPGSQHWGSPATSAAYTTPTASSPWIRRAPSTSTVSTHALGIHSARTPPPPMPMAMAVPMGPPGQQQHQQQHHPGMIGGGLMSHPVGIGAPSYPAELAGPSPGIGVATTPGLGAGSMPTDANANVWVSPEGVTYELVSQAAGAAPPPLFNNRITSGIGVAGEPQPKVDPQGRLWMPAGRAGAGAVPGTAFGSPPPAQRPVAEAQAAPVELSSEVLTRYSVKPEAKTEAKPKP